MRRPAAAGPPIRLFTSEQRAGGMFHKLCQRLLERATSATTATAEQPECEYPSHRRPLRRPSMGCAWTTSSGDGVESLAACPVTEGWVEPLPWYTAAG